MDGISGTYFGRTMNGDHAFIDTFLIDRRALQDPAFLIDTILVDQTTGLDNISASVKFTYIDSLNTLSNPVIFQLALVESSVNGNTNVVRKLLLNPEGVTVNRTWAKADEWIVDVDYTMDVPVSNPDSLYLVAFVQDKTTRRIHQARIVKAPKKNGIIPVGVIDDPRFAEIGSINVYPNPASKVINFYIENELTRNYGWHIVDQRGITVMEGNVNHDLSTPQQVEIKDLANGIYFVRFTEADKTIVYRKIAILNSN
jgi:hypothetical protein